MTRLEKLAKDYAATCLEPSEAEWGYLEGFRAAREMASERIRQTHLVVPNPWKEEAERDVLAKFRQMCVDIWSGELEKLGEEPANE